MGTSTSRSLRVLAFVAALCFVPVAGMSQDSNSSETTESSEASAESNDSESTSSQSTDSDAQLQRGDDMQFDARLVRGERASGAVFLFERTRRRLPSMVEKRRTYLEESVRSLLGSEWSDRLREARDGTSTDDTEGSSGGEDEDDIIDELAAEYEGNN